MFNRRMLLALTVCLAISASSAFAGGSKKGQHVIVKNSTGTTVFAFVGKTNAEIQAKVVPGDGLKTVANFLLLGGKQLGNGASAKFSVDAGKAIPATVVAIDGSDKVNQELVDVEKGKDVTVEFKTLVDLPPAI